MNTSKLHIIARYLIDELDRTQVRSRLNKLRDAIQNQINQPQQGNHQKQVSNSLNALHDALLDSPVDDFSPAWHDVLSEMRLHTYFGEDLDAQLRSIFERNTITLQVAHEEVQELASEIERIDDTLRSLTASLEYLAIGEDTLPDDTCEIGVTIPRAYVDNSLRSFGSEIVNLDKILQVFSELATGSRNPIDIRQISSSDLSVFLNYFPETAAAIAFAVERLSKLYERLLNIKKLKKELESNEVPQEKLTGLQEHIDSEATPAIEQIVEALMEKYGTHFDAERKKEITTELRHALKRFANRIDRGFNVEIRVPEQPRPDGDDTSEEPGESSDDSSRAAAIAETRESASRIHHHKPEGSPVLYFPEERKHTDNGSA